MLKLGWRVCEDWEGLGLGALLNADLEMPSKTYVLALQQFLISVGVGYYTAVFDLVSSQS